MQQGKNLLPCCAVPRYRALHGKNLLCRAHGAVPCTGAHGTLHGKKLMPVHLETLSPNAMFYNFCWSDEIVSDTIPKLITSEEAWTYRTWIGSGYVLLRVGLDGKIDLKPHSVVIPDQFIPNSPDGMLLPPELLEVIFLMASEENIAAQALTTTCRRSREMVMKRRRREAFTLLTKRFLSSEIVNSFLFYGVHPFHLSTISAIGYNC